MVMVPNDNRGGENGRRWIMLVGAGNDGDDGGERG